ncbi:MAG: M55 family metallopeptidase [Thermostichales cyanobacterium DRC_bins_46]
MNMKIYISADLEGVAGACQWSDVTYGDPHYAALQRQLHREVRAAWLGCQAAGATAVWIKDAHDSGRNLDPQQLPRGVTLVRGWSGHPYSMIQGLDETFTALVMIGYHSRSGSRGHPLAHTLNPDLAEVRVNGKPVAEFHLMAYAAASYGVPTVFVSGDQALCQEIHTWDPGIVTVVTQVGLGESVVVEPVEAILEQIEAGVAQALRHPPAPPPPPPAPTLEVVYKHPPQAYRRSFYPGAYLVNETTVGLESQDWFDLMRALRFIGF